MKEVIAVLVFCLVLFIYLHVFFHLKKCDDLEIYEICDPSKEKLEEICDIRQPVVTFFSNDNLMEKNWNPGKFSSSTFEVSLFISLVTLLMLARANEPKVMAPSTARPALVLENLSLL